MGAVAGGLPRDQPPAPRRSYDLHFREGPGGGFVWRYRDAGIVLTPTAMEWRTDGVARTTDYTTIHSIRLQTGHVPKSGTFGACLVTFRNGRTLTVNDVPLTVVGVAPREFLGTAVGSRPSSRKLESR